MFLFDLSKSKWLRLVFISLLFSFVTTSKGLYNNQPARYQNGNIRQRAQVVRQQKTKEILELMNTEANPCQDFFEFACGKWAAIHPPTRAGEVTSPQSEIQTQINKDLRALLTEQRNEIMPLEQKVLDFYQSCVTVQKTSQAQRSFMFELVRNLDGLPSIPSTNWHVKYDWLGVVVKLRAEYGLNVLINFEIDNDDNMKNAIYLGEPKTTIIPAENCSASAMETMNLRDEGYEAIQDEISANMQSWLSMQESDAKRFGGDIVRFEFELCKKIRAEPILLEEEKEEIEDIEDYDERLRNSRRPKNYNRGRSRVKEIGPQGERPIPLSVLAQFEDGKLNLRRYVESVLGTPYNQEVYLRSEEYLKHLARITRGTNSATIANYLMYHALSAFNFPRDDEPTNRPAYCVQQVQRNFPKILGEMYSAKHLKQNDMGYEVESYFTDISNALRESFNAEWIAPQAKNAAAQKLSNIKSNFPRYQNLDQLDELTLHPTNYWLNLNVIMRYNARNKMTTPPTIESFDAATKLIPSENGVLVGYALLQPPFINRFYARGMNYASLGQQLARELALAFDEQGWRANSLSRQPLDRETEQGLRNQTECFRTQYSNYIYNNPEEFRNVTRIREIIADTNGVNIAFNAYLEWLKNVDPHELEKLRPETLQTINFTNTQLFFIHFAQLRCAAKYGDGPPPKYLPLDAHTPERYDVNGPLSNSIEFAREFGCRSGDEMSAADKCVTF